jgi:hypothetical protein
MSAKSSLERHGQARARVVGRIEWRADLDDVSAHPFRPF